MPKKQAIKEKEEEKVEDIEEQNAGELIEIRRVAMTPERLDDIKKYVDFLVRGELKPIKQELEPIILQLKVLTEQYRKLLEKKPEDLQLIEPKSGELSLPTFMALNDIIALYNEGKISLGRAAELSRLKYDVMIDELQKRGIKLRLGPEDLEEALQEERVFRETMKRS